MATLLHDDIIDHSALRRHSPSPYARYGSTSTLLAGDFLLTRAFSLCAHLDRYIIDATEEACVHLTEGEILETPLFECEHDLDSSAMIARKKTAALFRLGTRSAGYLASLPNAAVEALALFGDKLGIAFQMLDDILDITSSEDLLGKQTGTDLRERKPSLVNVLWLRSGSLLAKNLCKEPDANDGAFTSAAIEELRSSPVIAQARSIARGQALEARQALSDAVSVTEQAGKAVSHELVLGLDAVITYTLNRMQ
jgi:octaprenyl-diphosphate synthase